MAAYYNEFDPHAAAWIRELIKQKLIADGEVDERSITEVSPDDLRGFDQCHFFAGIGGWSFALRLAGIPDDYPVWTASLPCQPFSAAGKQLGKADERHLLPHYLALVRQCKPAVQFGEQVASAIRHGWACDLQAAMEAEGYAVGFHVLGAHSVGSYHQRQRLYWVADGTSERSLSCSFRGIHSGKESPVSWNEQSERCLSVIGLAYDGGQGHQKQSSNGRVLPEASGYVQRENIAGSGRLGDTKKRGCGKAEPDGCRDSQGVCAKVAVGRTTKHGSMGFADCNGCESGCESATSTRHRNPADTAGWHDTDWLYCRDNKFRPIKSGLKPLVNGIPRGMVRSSNNGAAINANETAEARLMRLKGYGNAIVPQVAAEFISAFMDVL
jgi:DNA (cytosine-5)-methyltransferase 1